MFTIITHQHRWFDIRHFVVVILWHRPYNSYAIHIGCMYANISHRYRPPYKNHHHTNLRSDCFATADFGDNLNNLIRWVHHMYHKCYDTDDNGCYHSTRLKVDKSIHKQWIKERPKKKKNGNKNGKLLKRTVLQTRGN